MTLLVTGAAGLLGSSFVLDWLTEVDDTVVNLDELTYAGSWNEKPNIEIAHTVYALLDELGGKRAEAFETGIRKTEPWYLGNPEWGANIQSCTCREWMAKQYKGAAA